MRITCTVNGQPQQADDVWEGESLLYVLRERLGFPGSKNACEQGECGSCTVYLDGVLACSCLVAAGQAQGRDVRTVEGLRSGTVCPASRRPSPRAARARACVRRRSVRHPAGIPRGGRGPVRLLHAGAAGRRARPHRAAGRSERRGDPRGAGRQPVPVHRLRKDHGSGQAGRAAGERELTMDTTIVLNGCAVVTMDGRRTEHANGHVIVEDGRISAVAAGPAPRDLPGARYVDATGCLATPGLVNTHHHLYQWASRGLAVDSTLFGWLTELYPVWGRIDAEIVFAAARGGLAWLATTGCTTTTDHHYVFPHGGGDVLTAEIDAAREVGLRFHPTRGSMDLGQSHGGLPPDNVVEDIDAILAATEAAIDTHHDPSPGSMVRIGVAPCSPFTVTEELLTQAAALARRKGVRLHTHLAETMDEDTYCREHFGGSPVDYMDG